MDNRRERRGEYERGYDENESNMGRARQTGDEYGYRPQQGQFADDHRQQGGYREDFRQQGGRRDDWSTGDEYGYTRHREPGIGVGRYGSAWNAAFRQGEDQSGRSAWDRERFSQGRDDWRRGDDRGTGERGQRRDSRFGDRGERDFFDKAADEVSSWFGDERAEQRREMDRFRGRGPKNYARSDERILEDINDRLTDDGWLDASDIEVTVTDREVTLTGHVDSRAAKRRAEDIAETVTAVRHVQNNLRVRDNADLSENSGFAEAKSNISSGYKSDRT